MKINLLVRAYTQMMGLERYTASLCQALTNLDIEYSLVTPDQPFFVRVGHWLLKPFGLDLETFFTTYPLAARTNRADMTHLTAQQMATLLWTKPRLHPVVVTVHDIIPFLVREDPTQTTFRHPMDHWFDRLAMQGLTRAEGIICDSHFTRQTVINELAIDPQRIFVVHLAVDHTVFFPQTIPQSFYDRYQLDSQLPYLLYVGSENPRKNLTRLIQAFARLRARIPEVQLIKIGTPEYLAQDQSLQHQVRELGIENAVRFFDHVSDEDLALFYNFALLFVFPSIYEGFGLPPLEAMACGTPVVCSNAASLPEVVGDAAIMVDPYDLDWIENAMHQGLTNKTLRKELRQKGLVLSNKFSWQRTARETIAVYNKILLSDQPE